MTSIRSLLTIGFISLALCGTALAQEASRIEAKKQEKKAAAAATADPAATSGQPIEITADTALEWDRANRKYIARGNAIAKQNDFEVQADTLIAEYREGPKGDTQIYRLTADGNVVLTNLQNKGYGDHAVYEVDSALATMTGKDLKIVNPETTITAKEKFEYFSNEGKMVAYGSPVITNQDTQLTADKVTAWTAPKAKEGETTAPSNPNAKMKNLKRAEAEGNVVITNPKEKATSDKAVYSGETDTVELLGNVKLFQGPSTLEGSRAEMNLTTKLSKIFGGPEKNGRVKGIFFPGSKSDDKKEPAKN